VSVVDAPDTRLVVQALNKLKQLSYDASGNMRVTLPSEGSPGSSPPPKGVYLLGLDTDNNVVRPVAVDPSGKVRLVLG